MEESVGKGKHLKGRTRLINMTRNGRKCRKRKTNTTEKKQLEKRKYN